MELKTANIENRGLRIRNQYLLRLGLILIGLLSLNLVSSSFFTRFDLTNEKRYTLSQETKNILTNLDDIVYFRVYLEGDFPAGFKRLRRETKEMLDEFRAYNKNIQYEFINPSASENATERNDTYRLLMEQGLNPTDLQVKTKSGVEQQVIFPGALLSYRDKEMPVELLDAQLNVPPEAVLNNSIQSLEFKLMNAIHLLSRQTRPKIAFIEGHGELTTRETFDIGSALKSDYIVERISIDGKINALVGRIKTDSAGDGYSILPKYAAIIIAQPDSLFSPKDRFIIDQYIMYGGKVMWLIDPVLASMDSIQFAESTIAVEKNLDLQGQLFTYGARLNNDLVMDLNALPIPIKTGQVGNQPQIDFFPWYYFPLITPLSVHPVVKNLNSIKTQFVSSIDTLRTKNVKKTILLSTSDYSRTVNVPAMITLAITRQQPDESLFAGPPRPVAVLLEGEFASDFRGRIPPSIAGNKEIGFREFSLPTSMIIISDGDIIRNQFHIPSGDPLPLGYDQFTRETFGNKTFILNSLNYLIDGPGLISLRSREISLRLLDKTKVSASGITWQVVNMALPVIIVLVFAVLMIYQRKRKYTT